MLLTVESRGGLPDARQAPGAVGAGRGVKGRGKSLWRRGWGSQLSSRWGWSLAPAATNCGEWRRYGAQLSANVSAGANGGAGWPGVVVMHGCWLVRCVVVDSEWELVVTVVEWDGTGYLDTLPAGFYDDGE